MITLAPSEALEFPVDELALLVLADLVKTNEWNEYNYTNTYNNDQRLGYSHNKPALYALAEALGWLRTQGLIARTPGMTADAAIFVTRAGRDALTKKADEIQVMSRLQGGLHPLIERKARRQFMLGEYENAIFVAMKAIEIRIRSLGGFGDEVTGVELMTKALKPGGPLADPGIPTAEVEGTMALFRGAYAVLRNPSGHREVSFDNVNEASEAVMTASLLMRILDRIERRVMSA